MQLEIFRPGRSVFSAGVIAIFSWLLLPLGAAYADPPDWAPAHGWRKKHERKDREHRRDDWHVEHHDDEDEDDHRRDEWRKRDDWHEHRRHDTPGYSGQRWPKDYGVISGHCDYRAVGAVVGGVIGGVVGARVGDSENRPIAILLGSVVGAVVGANVGRSIEEVDRGCIAHSLELAQDNHPVAWNNPHTGATYLVTPHEGFEERGHICRNFDVLINVDGKDHPSRGRACQSNGAWQLQ